MFTELQGLLDALLHTGIGPIMLARDNPRAYPFMLGAIGVSLFVTLIGCGLRVRKTSTAIWEIAGLIAALVTLWLVWLLIATPAAAIPFWRAPATTDTWWFLPAHSTYAFIAVALRTILLLILGLVMAATWLVQATGLDTIGSDTPMGILSGIITISVWISPLAIFVETRSVPLLYTGTVELVGVVLIGFAVGLGLQWIFSPADPKPSFDEYKRARTVERLSDAIAYFLVVVGTLGLAYIHPFSNDWFQLIALFCVLTWIDGVITSVWSSLKQDKRNRNLLAPRRWLLTIPLTVAIWTLGANGILTPYLGATHIAPSIWSTASAAAAAYMLFEPLVTLATYVAGVRARQQEDPTRTIVFRVLAAVELLRPPTPPLVANAARDMQAEQDQSSALPPENSPIGEYLRMGSRDINRERELRIYENLNFPTWWVFLVVLILLRLTLLYVNLAGGFNNLLVTFIFGLFTLISGAINLFDNKTLVATRPVFLMLVLVISVVAATSLGSAIPAIDATPGAQEFFQTVQQLLIVTTVGQLAYLYRVVDATISSEQAETEDPDTEGLAEYAYTLYHAKKYEKAIEVFGEVNRKYPENSHAWHLKGYAHLLLEDGKYTEAIESIKEAIDLVKDQETPDALNNHGDYLDSLGRIYLKMGEEEKMADQAKGKSAFEDARKQFEASLRYQPNNVDTLTMLAQTLHNLGAEDEAKKVDEQIAALKVKHA